jgi:hypothetical protein
MTKEELEKEAEEWLCNNLHFASEEDFIKAMVDIAEPREKRIAELEKEKCELLGIIQGKDKAIKDLEEEYAYQLIKAKKIIGNLYAICKDNHYPNSSILMEEAEQFLKENKYDRQRKTGRKI